MVAFAVSVRTYLKIEHDILCAKFKARLTLRKTLWTAFFVWKAVGPGWFKLFKCSGIYSNVYKSSSHYQAHITMRNIGLRAQTFREIYRSYAVLPLFQYFWRYLIAFLERELTLEPKTIPESIVRNNGALKTAGYFYYKNLLSFRKKF